MLVFGGGSFPDDRQGRAPPHFVEMVPSELASLCKSTVNSGQPNSRRVGRYISFVANGCARTNVVVYAFSSVEVSHCKECVASGLKRWNVGPQNNHTCSSSPSSDFLSLERGEAREGH